MNYIDMIKPLHLYVMSGVLAGVIISPLLDIAIKLAKYKIITLQIVKVPRDKYYVFKILRDSVLLVGGCNVLSRFELNTKTILAFVCTSTAIVNITDKIMLRLIK